MSSPAEHVSRSTEHYAESEEGRMFISVDSWLSEFVGMKRMEKLYFWLMRHFLGYQTYTKKKKKGGEGEEGGGGTGPMINQVKYMN